MRHKAWSQGWKALSQEDRTKYQMTSEVKHLNERPIESMSTKEKVALVKQTIVNMKKEVLKLIHLGSSL